MGTFQPLSKDRAEEIRRALTRSRSGDEGLAFNETGECVGTATVSAAPDDRRNVIAKYDTHYAG